MDNIDEQKNDDEIYINSNNCVSPTITINEAIEHMKRVPSIEFICCSTKQLPDDGDNAERNVSKPCADESNLYIRTNYRLHSSPDAKLTVPVQGSPLTRRSHSIHIVDSNHRYNNRSTKSPSNGQLIRSTAMNQRRSTIHRILNQDEDIYVPKQSWLTSIYIKMPKSKSFCHFQLKLLNLPLFASTVRYLEETATGNNKEMLQSNSFLYAVFNQFVPHNRILVNTLSKHVRRIRKHEILAIIEFNVS